MFIGHAAVGFAVKRAAPRVPLWVLLTAVFLADMIWPILLLLGIEHVRIDPGNTPVTPLDFYDFPYTHSLPFAIGWSLLFGWGYAALTRDRKGARWVFLAVMSHWVLDLVSHRPDLPLWPGGPEVGLGLWYSKPATIVVEVAMFLAGLWIYLRATRARGWLAHVALGSLVVTLAFAYFGNMTGPPPPDVRSLALFGLVGWLFVPWAWWIDATRETVVR